MQEARCFAQDPAKLRRDPVLVDADEKGQDRAPGRDSEDDDVDVDEEEPVSYKTTPHTATANEPLKKKWSRQAEEAARQSPPPSTAPQPPMAHTHAPTASDKGEGNLLAMHSLMDRSLYEKGLLTNLKPNGLLARAT